VIDPIRTEVLIVGAGPVGLALAIELGLRSVNCLVVEQHDRVGLNPRAKLTNVRSREHLRRWGIADELRRASGMAPDYPPNIVFATRLNGYLLARFENAFYCARARSELYSEPGQWVPQFVLEEVLRRRAAELPAVEIRFGCRLERLAQDGEGVTAEFRDLKTGARGAVRAAYLAAADGARSTVRELLGIRMHGEGALAPNLNVIFRAPALAGLHDKGPAIQYWMVNREAPAYLGPMDRHGLWFLIAPRLPDGTDFDRIDPKELVRRASGLEFDLEIVHADPWTAQRLIAERYGEGRVFLAGDACHLHPPSGGHGMNMGIGDAVDLGWKLAATLNGWGGPGLLDTYEIERKPVHERVINAAVESYALVGGELAREDIERPGAQGDRARTDLGELILRHKLPEFRSLGVVLGYRYRGSPITVPDGTDAPPEEVTDYRPSAHPGCLAPHLWLGDGSSLYDHFGPGFTLLLRGEQSMEKALTLQQAAAARQLPLELVAVAEPRFGELYEAEFALVRPDQHVAWRGDRLPGNPLELLDRVRGAVAHARAALA
jgi:2-polyprenyl-6-methoxyphenol hydroxylase-like FAD-dependent oxidoreductase